MSDAPWQISKIVETAISLKQTGGTAASTGERIAGAFVLNRMDLLPDGYGDVVEAWDRLGDEWQHYVRTVKREYMHLIYEDSDDVPRR